MTIILPSEILLKIFAELRKDATSLHSCALVNRQWCENALIYLWLQPFKLLEKFRRDDPNNRSWNERATCLVQTYFSCIQYQEKLNTLSNDRHRSTLRQPQQSNIKPPTFNYLQYLKSLDIGEFSNALLGMAENTQGKRSFLNDRFTSSHHKNDSSHMGIIGYTKTTASKPQRLGYNKFISAVAAAASNHTNVTSSRARADLYNRTILGKILRNPSINLKTLSISNQMEPYSWLHSLLPSTNHHLANLSKFICTTACNAELYMTLSKSVVNLRKIKIWMDYYPPPNIISQKGSQKHGMDSLEAQVEGLIILIKSQRNLQHFELGYCGLGLDDIITALGTQVRSLRTITFFRVDFKDWRSLLKLISETQLDRLMLSSCYYLQNCVSNLPYNDISSSRITRIIISTAPSQILESLISRANISLEELEISQIQTLPTTTITNSITSFTTFNSNYNAPHNLQPRNILETISLHCPNLTIARLYIDTNTISKLPLFISSCINLKCLTIFGPKYPEINVDNIFREISVINANNLEKLAIRSSWTFTAESLELFLESFSKLKEFEILWSCCVNNDHFEVLLDRFRCGGEYHYHRCDGMGMRGRGDKYGKYGKKSESGRRYTSNDGFVRKDGKCKNKRRGRCCVNGYKCGSNGKEKYYVGLQGKRLHQMKRSNKLEDLRIQTKHIINVELIRQIQRVVGCVRVWNW
ncbi:3559_t:CDS:1 [Acaulospora morrowiae]|uniref:3559_t:CDS:1 n=1 Tax=Acaulospora morrowiae TaxID=94023 RepID=A0A9N8V8Q4_9GLOM|nr:3559_t:CDS:1 [Acaulospora morrowiae]